MKAETVHNVISALSPEELQRLYVMLEIQKKPKAPKRKPVYTLADAMEYIHAKFYKK